MATEPPRSDLDFTEIGLLLGKSFTLHPITEAALFAGRKEQRRDLLIALGQAGLHPIVYGERGAGKTSFANLAANLNARLPNPLAIKVNCDSKDTFGSVWRKVFERIKEPTGEPYSLRLDDEPNPEEVRAVIEEIAVGRSLLIVIDEFDKYPKAHTEQMADTMKTLYDNVTPAKLILVGVADSVEDLIQKHGSVGRALAEIRMPRMSPDEIAEIVENGLGRVGMSIEPECVSDIVSLSQGLPHYAQLLGLNSGLQALDAKRLQVERTDLELAIAAAVRKTNESIQAMHHKATLSPRKDNLFEAVLLACALAKTDNKRYFAAADVRGPMSAIMKKRYEITAFAQHLNEFADDKRGPILHKIGRPRSYRFRFMEPLLQPYAIMLGLSRGMITKEQLAAIQNS